MQLRPVTYQLDIDKLSGFLKTPLDTKSLAQKNKKETELHSGFIAQEVEQAALSLGYDFHGVDKPQNENSHYGLRYALFVVPLVKGMQEQQITINELKEENTALKKRLDKIEELLNNR
jgi:Tfp pilus assembly protein PilN